MRPANYGSTDTEIRLFMDPQHEIEKQDDLFVNYQKLVAARQTATEKLRKLGFTDDEIAALVG